MTVSDPIIITAFGIAYSAMVGCITVLWRKSNKCESDRIKMWERIMQLTPAKELLDSCPAKHCPHRRDDDDFNPPPLNHALPL